MKYSLRSLMIVAILAPPLLALGIVAVLRELKKRTELDDGQPYPTLDLEWQPVENLGPGAHSVWLNPPNSSAPAQNPPKK